MSYETQCYIFMYALLVLVGVMYTWAGVRVYRMWKKYKRWY